MGAARGWCGKLMDKAKKHKMKVALGSSGRFHVDKPSNGGVKAKDRDGLPRAVSPRRRVGNGCVLSPAIRAEVERRKVAREAFLQGLRGA